MIKWLNYHHLLYFREIANEGSIVKASKKLNVGQSALSSQLKQLEENLSQKLFERKNKTLVITDAGKVALEYAEEIFKKGEEFIQVFNERTLSLKNRFKLGVVDSAPKSLSCQLAVFSQKKGEDSAVTLVEGTPSELLQRLNSHEIELFLTNNISVVGKEDLIVKSIGKSPVGVYAAESFLNLKENFPQSMQDQPLILPTRHSKLRYDLEHHLMSLKIQYNLTAEVQDSSVKKLMGAQGMGLIFLPEFAGDEQVRLKNLIKIGMLDEVYEEYWLVTRKRTIQSSITEQVLAEFTIQ